MFYCGIDIAKYKHEAAVIDEAGMALLDSISFANSKEGCEKLLALFQRLDIAKDALIVGMEATGHYWLSVYGYGMLYAARTLPLSTYPVLVAGFY